MLRQNFVAARARTVALIAALAAALSLAGAGRAGVLVSDTDEVRALWVQRTSLTSPAAVAMMVDAARRNGFNTLLVQVRGRGDAYFNRSIEPRASLLSAQSSDFDPLAHTLTLAHDGGLRVHAWVSVNLIASAADLPSARDHLVYRHPEWLMIPRGLVPQLGSIPSESPEYVGKLARWSRAQSATVEGLYLSPIPAGAVDHTVAVVSDLVRRYSVDGVHLDYVRFPSDEFDYSRSSVAQFRAEILPQLTPAVRRELDDRLQVDPIAYPDAFPERWHSFRQSRLTALVMRIRTAVKALRPGAVLSAAVVPELQGAAERHMQDWHTWLDNGLLDVVCPMAYTQDAATFRMQIEAATQAAGFRPVWAGIGAYRLTADQTADYIRAARQVGVKGVVLFSYDNLVTPTTGAEYLSQVARVAFKVSGH